MEVYDDFCLINNKFNGDGKDYSIGKGCFKQRFIAYVIKFHVSGSRIAHKIFGPLKD